MFHIKFGRMRRINLRTSYFAISSELPNAVSIALKAPDFYIGKEYLPLAPTCAILTNYKKTKNIHTYTERYIEEILLPLNAKTVYDELGHFSVLLCWESSEKFCHRHIVAKWIEDSLGVKIPEL